MPSRSACLIAAAGIDFKTAAASAQRAPAGQTPSVRTNAREVVVDVVVPKGKHEPVLALPKGDFQIFEDGKPQAIDFFQERAAKTLPQGAVPSLPKMSPTSTRTFLLRRRAMR